MIIKRTNKEKVEALSKLDPEEGSISYEEIELAESFIANMFEGRVPRTNVTAAALIALGLSQHKIEDYDVVIENVKEYLETHLVHATELEMASGGENVKE